MSSSDDTKINCLMVLSASKPGISFDSFYKSCKILSTELNLDFASPNAGVPTFLRNFDSVSRTYINSFPATTRSTLLSLSTIDPEKYSALVIPHSPGAVADLAEDQNMARILLHFVQNHKPICAIGMGVVGLFPAFDKTNLWCFRRFKLTGTTVFELTKNPDLHQIGFPEDVIKERGGIFTSSNDDTVADSGSEGHVEVDRFVITGQNEQSTTAAIQSFLLECKQKMGTNKVKS